MFPRCEIKNLFMDEVQYLYDEVKSEVPDESRHRMVTTGVDHQSHGMVTTGVDHQSHGMVTTGW